MLAVAAAPRLYAWDDRLHGTPMGSVSVDYSTGLASESVNTPAAAFDGKYNTYYASYDRSNTWVGLDLGRKCVITGVGYASRAGRADRLQLGIFEGSNSPDFLDAVPLYIIKDKPSDNVLVNDSVHVSRAFRYVRYVGPNNARCNIAEVCFYGHKGEGNDSLFYTPTNLPLLTIHTVNCQGINDRVTYIRGYINVISGGGTGILSDSLNIRGRGNATWGLPKKPYKIKLDHKAHMLGMPAKDKKWVLLSNYSDKTLIRNLLAFRVSELIGLSYTPAGRLADVMLNGEYIGNYQICDQVEVGKHRVDITKMTLDDNTGDALTGGYLVEIDSYADREKSKFTTSDFSLPVSIKYPDEDDITPAQSKYIAQTFGTMVRRVNSSFYNNPVYGFRRYLDEDSFLRNFMVNEVAANSDALWSVRMYKERDSLRFYTGPVWDFDLGFENDSRVHPVSQYSDFVSFTPNATTAGNMRGFTQRIINVSADRMKYLWSHARYDLGLTVDTLEAYIDSLADYIDESQKLNFIRWPILSTPVLVNYQALGSYTAELGTVRDFIRWRIPWLDEKIGLIPVGIGDVRSAVKASAWAVSGGVSLSGLTRGDAIEVFTPDGMSVTRAEATGGEQTIALPAGIYIIKAGSGKNIIRSKIDVR